MLLIIFVTGAGARVPSVGIEPPGEAILGGHQEIPHTNAQDHQHQRRGT